MRVIDYDDVVRAARHRFLATSSLEMDQLASDLAVSRATLYRVITSQDRLLGDMLWELTERTLAMAVEASRGHRGVDRILALSSRFEGDIAGFRPLQLWMERDPLQASRVLFTPAGGIHGRVVRAFERIFAAAVAAGELVLPTAPADFAYLYVRLGETLVHGELLAGITPDPEAADRLRRAMFELGTAPQAVETTGGSAARS